MKILYLFLLSICVLEIYGQRSRTTIQEQSQDEPKPVRGRGRARFTIAQDTEAVAEQTPRSTSNRRASTRTRIHSNNPKAAADRRAARPTESPRPYSTEVVNNESPIDSFIRQSKSRVLTETRFEIPSATLPKRPTSYEAIRTSPLPPVTENIPDDVLTQDFGSTARAILQARGEVPTPRTTTPRVDQEYLLNNFGSTIKSLAAASRSFARKENTARRGPVLRSEIPIIERGDIPSRRSSVRGDPLPSLKGSDITLDREQPARSKSSSKLVEAREKPKVESQKFVNEEPLIEEAPNVPLQPEEPEIISGLSEQSEETETQPLEVSSETILEEEEDYKKTTSYEVSTPRTTEPAEPRRVLNGRRNGGRGRLSSSGVSQTAAPSRVRVQRPRSRSDPEPAASSTRIKSTRRYDDSSVAESRVRGPSVFTAEQTSEVTSRSRPGRRIDTSYDTFPQKVTIELPTTVRSRNSGRRVSAEAQTTEKSSARSSGRGRSRSGSRVIDVPSSSTTAIPEVSTKGRIYSVTESSYGTRSSNRRSNAADQQVIPSRKESTRSNNAQGRQSRRQNPVDNSFRRSSLVESSAPRVAVPELGYVNRGASKTRVDSISTTLPPITANLRSRSRFSESPPKLDESKLEVLPLFEREPKTDSSARSRGQRSRSSVSRRQSLLEDPMQFSATENDVKFVEKPTTAFTRVTVTRTESVEASTSRARMSTRVASSNSSTTPKTTSTPSSTLSTRRSTITTTTTGTPVRRSSSTTTQNSTTTKKWVTKAPPLIKESVVAEVNEVTSKTTFTRRKKVPKTKPAESSSRGSKKAEIKVTDAVKKKGSEEDIDEEDNYPEPFKALLQAKKKEESRSPSAPSRSATSSTERAFVTSSSPSRASSTARVVTTAPPAVVRKPQVVNEIVNDIENELDPKTIITTTPLATTLSRFRPSKHSEKPKFTPKSKDRFYKPTTEKSKKIEEKHTKPTAYPRKSFTPKVYSTKAPYEHHAKRKALRSTAVPPSTTPVTRESKFSAKFVRKEFKSLEAEATGKSSKSVLTKGGYSNRKKDNGEEDLTKKLESTPLPIKKSNSSRFSSRYRSELPPKTAVLKTATTKPYYIPTIPTPAYIPTVPTIKPSIVQDEDGYVVETDKDLGVEVISFDDPINSIPSADLVNGEYLATDKNLRLSSTVKDGTTEKPVSIIERIINSITSISTTALPNITTTNLSTTTEATENSAILKLAPKKATTKDKTKPDDSTNETSETITSEKPTTIIEKILTSLSAIQTNEVGTSDLNTFGGQNAQLPSLSRIPKQNVQIAGNNDNLANRIISLAVEREKSRSTTTKPPQTTKKPTTKATTQSTTKRPNSIQDQLPITKVESATKRTTPSLDEILKQYNLDGLSTPSPLSSTYGKTDEALLAAILKEQGIGPTTPKDLGEKVKQAGLFEENPATKAPRPKSKPRPAPTQRPRGRLMQGLNWLLDFLDPPTTKRPAPRKNKPKKTASGDEAELLSNQPTRITPVVSGAPVSKPNLSQEEIQNLIKQLEAARNDPKAVENLDFSKIKSLQNLINVNEGVQVTSAGQHGTTLRVTSRPRKVKSTVDADELDGSKKKFSPSTASTLSVSNSIDDDEAFDFSSTTTRTRLLPPVSLNPVPGIDDQDSLIRGNLLTAAVNVTRAISSFLGTALQGATRGFRTLLSSGSSLVGNISQSSGASSAG